jgi:MFS family permease
MTDPDPVPWRLQLTVYGLALFSTSMFYMASVVVPLYVVMLKASPLLIGVALAARHFLPLLFSIHSGALMDRLGPRRVMLFFAVVGMITPLLYPALPWIGAVLVLQMIGGMADSMGWLGAQTVIGHQMKGRSIYTGRLSFSVRFGHIVAPPAIGAIWDTMGPWWAFWGLGLWGLGVVVTAWMLPDAPQADKGPDNAPSPRPRPRLRARDFMPRAADYLDAFRLLTVPTIAIVIMASMMSHVGNAVQSSFYVVWISSMGISGTTIGLLLAANSVCAAAGSLLTARSARYIRPIWMILSCVLAGVLLIAITPLLGTVFLLMVASSIRGATNGLSQPLLISMVLRASGDVGQGKAVGMRGTCNRVASVAAPILMGALAELVGIENSFYLIGAVITVLMAMLVRHAMRTPDLADRED